MATLLLVELVHRAESAWVTLTCAARGGRNTSLRSLIHVSSQTAATAVGHTNARSFCPMLRYIGHLLRLRKHLNLFFLLLRKLHEIVEYVSLLLG